MGSMDARGTGTDVVVHTECRNVCFTSCLTRSPYLSRLPLSPPSLVTSRPPFPARPQHPHATTTTPSRTESQALPGEGDLAAANLSNGSAPRMSGEGSVGRRKFHSK